MRRLISILGYTCILVSILPIFLISWEKITDSRIDKQYEIQNLLTIEEMDDVQLPVTFEWYGQHLTIQEEPAHQRRSLSKENMNTEISADKLVNIRVWMNGNEVTHPDPILIADQESGVRYYPWLGVFKVNDKMAILQRLHEEETDNQRLQWKVIWIDKSGDTQEEKVRDQELKDQPLLVKLINMSGTGTAYIGYHSSILNTYPVFFYPYLYPYGTCIAGIVIVLWMIRYRKMNV